MSAFSGTGRKSDGHGGNQALPPVGFGSEMFSAFGGEAVEFGAAIVFGDAPFAGEEFPLFEAMQGRVERALFDFQRGSRDLFDAQQDSVAVLEAEGDSFEDQQIECAREQICGHFWVS
jgi:hypothetical protein